jgi:hypothetical protein
VVLPSPLPSRTSEGTLSLGTEEAQPPSGSRPGRRPLAVTLFVVSAAVLTLGGLVACSGGAVSTPSASAASSAAQPGRLILARTRRYT